MKIIVTNAQSGQHIKTLDYDGLLDICKGDVRMANDFIRLMRNHPKNQKTNERWTVVDEDAAGVTQNNETNELYGTEEKASQSDSCILWGII